MSFANGEHLSSSSTAAAFAGGMTSRTSAHLAPLCDDLVSEMTKIKGNEATKLFCDSQAAAVDRIEEIRRRRRSVVTSAGSTAICSPVDGRALQRV
jgi:hypothetical protein